MPHIMGGQKASLLPAHTSKDHISSALTRSGYWWSLGPMKNRRSATGATRRTTAGQRHVNKGFFLATPTKGCWGSSSLQYTAAEGGLLGRLTTLRLAEKVLGAWTLGSPLTDSLSRAQMSSYSAHLYFIV